MSDTRLMSHTGLYRFSHLIGTRVVNPRGEHLGQVVDFVVDIGENQVSAAILSLSGERGTPNRLVAIPMLALGYDPMERECLLNIDRTTLERAPSFRPDEWPELIDRVWAADLYMHYGFLPYWL
jgi:hypothetical protein